MQALNAAGAVLVVLHRDQRRLGLAVEAGDDPRLGIGLLQVVDRAVSHVLPELPVFAPLGQVVRRPVPAEGLHQQRVQGAVDVVASGHPGPQGGQERALHRGPEPQQVGVPLQVVVHPGEGAVVQLVADVEGELQVVPEGVTRGRQ